MGIQVRSLPTMSISTAATVSNTISALDDAAVICLNYDSTSTGTSTVEVELTETGTNFLPLFVTSTGTALTLMSGGVTTITEVGFRQMRVSLTSGVPTEALTFTVAKQIWL